MGTRACQEEEGEQPEQDPVGRTLEAHLKPSKKVHAIGPQEVGGV